VLSCQAKGLSRSRRGQRPRGQIPRVSFALEGQSNSWHSTAAIPQSLHVLSVHIVFSTKGRHRWLSKEIRPRVWAYQRTQHLSLAGRLWLIQRQSFTRGASSPIHSPSGRASSDRNLPGGIPSSAKEVPGGIRRALSVGLTWNALAGRGSSEQSGRGRCPRLLWPWPSAWSRIIGKNVQTQGRQVGGVIRFNPGGPARK